MSTVYLERILVKELLMPAKELKQYWVLEERGEEVRGVQTHYMESKGWNTVKEVVTRLGGEWISEKGSLAEFRIPKKSIPFPQPPIEKRELFEKSGEPESTVKSGIINGERSDVGRKRVAGNGREANLTSREPAQTVSETPPPQPEPSSATPGSPIGVGGVETTLDKERIEELKAQYEKGRWLYPILKSSDGETLDGRHREVAVPEWACEELPWVKTEEDKHWVNFVANWYTKDREWKTEMMRLWIEKFEKTPKEVSKETGISYRTLIQYVPDELKDKEMQELSEKAVGARLHREEKELNHMVACECCDLGTYFPVHIDGHFYCKNCVETGRYLEKPRRREKEKAVVTRPPLEVKTYKKPKETAEYRAAKMHPPVSQMEEKVLEALSGIPVAYEQEFCVQKTKPDIFFPDQNLAVYLDGPQHQGREDRDNSIREKLTKFHDIEVLSITYSGRYTKEECESIVEAIKKRLKET